jgi:DHA1 family inner membrane transport protein
MFMGLTVANIGGVPAATWISERLGWRESFMAIGLLGLVSIAALRSFLPAGGRGNAPDVKQELKVLLRPVVVQALLTTIAASASLFALYTYISPALTSITNAKPGFITAMLAVIGVGFTIGNSLGGKLADRSVNKTVAFFLTVEAVVMVAMPWLARTHIGAATGLAIWGIASFALVPPLQMRVMRAAAEAPGLASSVNIGAFNLGNAIGAALGATVLSAGLPYSTVMFVAAGMSALALTLVIWSEIRQHTASKVQSAPEKTCMLE